MDESTKSEKALAPELHQFASGGTRSKDADELRYDLISPVGLRRLAKRYADGAVTHGDRNWEKGIPASATLNHLLRHLNLWADGDRNDDHLAAAAWGCFALMHYEERVPDMMDVPYKSLLRGEQPVRVSEH